jgi:MoxR-like ATPase
MIDYCIAAILVGGHVLLEGVPGVAKTLTVKSIGRMLQLEFQRIQGTSDMMPADILGTNVLNQASGTFQLHRGPVFADLVLVDEINRMPPRTQAALLEAMEERQITIDGVRHVLNAYFTVFATQNPVEFEGTYPLPEAQLDRFLLKVIAAYPESVEDESRVLARFQDGIVLGANDPGEIAPLPAELLANARGEVRDVKVEPNLLVYMVRLARATREAPQVGLGASPRAAMNLMFVCKALAAMDGRDYVIPDDIKRAVLPVWRHRIVVRPEAQLEGLSADQLLGEMVRSVPVPK